MLFQFFFGIILARLLGPEAFGIFGIGVLIVGIGNVIADFGLSTALIQGKNITERDVAFVFTVHVIWGFILTVVGYISADSIAIHFRYPDGAIVIKSMSLLFFIQAFGQSADALLRRSLNFKAYQSINIVAYLCGYVLVGLPCAFYGVGVLSLVAAQLSQSILFSSISMWKVRHKICLALKPTHYNIFSFGGKVVCINLSNWGLSNFDSFLVGRFLGLSELGIYNRATVLIATPINTVTGALQSVLLAACSRVKTDTNQIGRAYLGASTILSLICLPLALTMASVSETVIGTIYGDKWIEAISVFQPLALTFAINALISITGPILTARNNLKLELTAEFFALLVMLPIVYLTAQKSVAAVAWSMFGISVIRWVLLLYALSISLDMPVSQLLKPVKWPLILALITAVLTTIIDQLLKGLYPLIHLVVDVTVAALSMLILLRIFGKRVMQGPHRDYLILQGLLPLLVQRWLGL